VLHGDPTTRRPVISFLSFSLVLWSPWYAGALMIRRRKNMFKKINADLQAAMKEKNAERLSVLRMMKSKILLVNARGELADEEITKIISKYAKSLKEAIEEAKKVGRADAAAETEKELKIVEEYLPKALSEEEIKAIVKQVIADTGATSAKDMGKVMKEVLQKAPGVDGKAVNTFARELLG
jgi:uncharacterized protein YqeY